MHHLFFLSPSEDNSSARSRGTPVRAVSWPARGLRRLYYIRMGEEDGLAEGWEVRGPAEKNLGPQVHVGPPFPEGDEDQVVAYELDLPEAREVEETHAVYRDLEFVINVADYLVKMMEQRERQA
jgi:hypothetical protein